MRNVSVPFGAFLLDFKLALRMLVKYPLLTLVGGIGMAFGIAAGVGGFELRSQFVDPTLPLDEGRRIVGLRQWDIRGDRPGPLSDDDFTVWRDQLERVDEISAAALVERNLEVDGSVEAIAVAEMTASAFRLARVAPVLGRALVEDDERPGAPAVAVIGYSLWQRRFRADPQAVGRSVRLGLEPSTIVGVMPEDFAFPVAHEIWTPLHRGIQGRSDQPPLFELRRSAGALAKAERTGPAAADVAPLFVFGRLAPGVTHEGAQAELTTIGRRMMADAPDTHEFLRPEVVPYAHLTLDPGNVDVTLGLTLANIFLITLVVVVSANVALLMFARAASREREIGVRYALGAGRGRIVAQLFAEGVALSGLSAILGLVAARYAIGWLLSVREAERGSPLPFWMNDTLSPLTVVYGVGLTMLVAVIIGVFPALKITGRQLTARLRTFSAGGGYRFSGVWTTVIAAQVAVTVLFPATAFFFHRWAVGGQTRDVGVAAKEFLSARLAMDSAAGGRTATIVEELRRQLLTEPGVTGVTVADRLPGMQHSGGRFEVEGDDRTPTYGHDARVASVDSEFFAALGVPLLSGRGFALSDVASGRDVAIVNTSFVERVMRGRNPVGHRVRLVARGSEQPAGPWIEIIGAVRDIGMSGTDGVGLYRPLAPDYASVRLALHVAGSPESFAARLRALASRVEPALRVHEIMALDKVGADQWLESLYLSRLLAVLSGIALLLSLMAIYAVLSFTVVQRTREIGTRVALGADRRHVIAAIARRPLVQIGLGIGAGGALVLLAFVGMKESAPTTVEVSVIALYAVLMLVVCLTACIVPIRRAISLEPSAVLRADG